MKHAHISGAFSWKRCLVLVAALVLPGCIFHHDHDGASDPEAGSPESTETSKVPSSATPPPAPTLDLAYQPVKTFRFTWGDVSGETEYRLLENPDGVSGYSQVASLPADATSHDLMVFLPGRVNASYMLQACNSAGCTDSNEVTVEVSRLVEAVGYVKASNTDDYDDFGHSLALSGDGSTLAVGAPGEASAATGIGGNQADNSAPGAGAVYVFIREAGGAWSQQAYVKASNTDSDDNFGHAVALSDDGSTLAVGAYTEASAATGIGGNQADNSARGAGAVYVFTRDASGAWSQQAYVKASNTDPADWFGYSVALSGDGYTLAVGARQEGSAATGIGGDQADNSARGAGAVYVFARDEGGTWSQQAYIKSSETTADGRGLSFGMFGHSVALSSNGNTLAVGAENEESTDTVYVFTRDANGTWSQQAGIKPLITNNGDWFGWPVALSDDGNTLAAGAFGEDSAATGVDGDPTDNSAWFAGAAYAFTRDAGGAWRQQAYIKASNTEAGDRFGYSLALSGDGNILAVGALYEASAATGIGGNQSDNSDPDAGAVYVFVRDAGGAWSQQAYVKASNTGAEFRVVALSGDGETLAVGARGEGAVYLY